MSSVRVLHPCSPFAHPPFFLFGVVFFLSYIAKGMPLWKEENENSYMLL